MHIEIAIYSWLPQKCECSSEMRISLRNANVPQKLEYSHFGGNDEYIAMFVLRHGQYIVCRYLSDIYLFEAIVGFVDVYLFQAVMGGYISDVD